MVRAGGCRWTGSQRSVIFTMAKTEVILTHNIVGLGAESDQVKVAAGYARNYLYPQRLAIPVSAGNKRRLEALRQRRAEREAHEFNAMSELAKGISKLTCVVKMKTGEEGKLFGSVTSGSIADELKHQFDLSIDKKKIHLEHPLKALGDYEVELRLHAEVTTTLKVKIESTTPAPPPAEVPEVKETGRGKGVSESPRTEKRGRRTEPRVQVEANPEKVAKPEKGPKPAKVQKTEKAK